MKDLINAVIDNIRINGFMHKDAKTEIDTYYNAFAQDSEFAVDRKWREEYNSLDEHDMREVQDSIDLRL